MDLCQIFFQGSGENLHWKVMHPAFKDMFQAKIW